MLILMLMSGLPVWSQTDRLDSLLSELLGNDKEMMKLLDPPSVYCYFYGGFAGDDKTFYAESENNDNIYGINGNIYLLHSKGFFAGASSLWFNQSDPVYSTTIATAGYLRALNRKKSLTFRASYNRYFFNRPDSVPDYSFRNNIGTGFTFKNKWIGGRLSMNLMFGPGFGINLAPSVFSRIALVRFGDYNKLQIEPEVSLSIGSETVEYTGTGDLSVTFSGSQLSPATEDVFGLLNMQFFIPVCLYIGNFDFELGYLLNIPATRDESISYPVSSFFTISLGYLLPLN